MLPLLGLLVGSPLSEDGLVDLLRSKSSEMSPLANAVQAVGMRNYLFTAA